MQDFVHQPYEARVEGSGCSCCLDSAFWVGGLRLRVLEASYYGPVRHVPPVGLRVQYREHNEAQAQK